MCPDDNFFFTLFSLALQGLFQSKTSFFFFFKIKFISITPSHYFLFSTLSLPFWGSCYLDSTSILHAVLPQSLSRVQLVVTPWTACSTPGFPVLFLFFYTDRFHLSTDFLNLTLIIFFPGYMHCYLFHICYSLFQPL